MATWGDQFKRFADSLTPLERTDPRLLAEHLAQLAGDMSRIGGVLYIPRRSRSRDTPGSTGTSGLWPLDLSQTIELGERIELMFAPGAGLLPMSADGAFELVLRGRLTAQRSAIFGPSSLARRVWPAMPSNRGPARVRLLSAAIDRVHPEWWGAGVGEAANDTDALQAAFDAARRDRRDGRTWLRPLVVQLSGAYQLTRPLLLDAPSGTSTEQAPGAFEVRGVPDAASQPNLSCVDGFVGEAMLVADGVDQVRLDEVRFDGRGAPRSCVVIRVRDSGLAPAGTNHHLRRCAFRGATEHLLRVEHDDLGGASIGANALLVEGCSFRPSMPADRRLASAVRLRTSPRLGVEFRSTTFEGDASAMIHATSTAVSLTHCSFHNGVMPTRLTTGSVEGLHDRGPEGGVDVFLDAFERTQPASLSAMHCASRSLQFLVTRGDAQTGGRNSTIVGLHHDVRPSGNLGPPLRLEDPPLLYRPREPDRFEPTPVITAPQQSKSVSTSDPGVVSTLEVVTATTIGTQVKPNNTVAIDSSAVLLVKTGPIDASLPIVAGTASVNANAQVIAKTASVEITSALAVEKSSGPDAKSLGIAAQSPNSIGPAILPGAASGSEFLPPTTALPPLEGRWISTSGQFLPLPPIIDWDGVAQGGNGLSLCGCRLDRPHPERTAAIVGRNLIRPIFDLGVLWGDPNNHDALFSVATAEGGALGLSTTARESRPVGPDVRR